MFPMVHKFVFAPPAVGYDTRKTYPRRKSCRSSPRNVPLQTENANVTNPLNTREVTDPSPEVLVMDLGDPDSKTVKVRVLGWTRTPRQHQMVVSYDSVLTAISQTLNRSMDGQDRVAYPIIRVLNKFLQARFAKHSDKVILR